MLDDSGTHAIPAIWATIEERSRLLGFDMASDNKTGALLRVLAASKPGGRLLEIGTGTGLATAYLLAGMDGSARLVSVDHDAAAQAVARELLGTDPRVSFVRDDGVDFLQSQAKESFDLVFADAWPGKYEALDVALGLVRRGGLFIGDDMLPQANWPENHQPRVYALTAYLQALDDWVTVSLCWGSGFVIAVRR